MEKQNASCTVNHVQTTTILYIHHYDCTKIHFLFLTFFSRKWKSQNRDIYQVVTRYPISIEFTKKGNFYF